MQRPSSRHRLSQSRARVGRLRKRPRPYRNRGSAEPLHVVLSDENRQPFPGYTPRPYGVRYYITALGRVYRDDGRLMKIEANLHVNLNRHPNTQKSLPKAVALAFGLKPPSYGAAWRAWVDPDGPIDPLTGRLRCSVADIVYVPHSELIAYYMSGKDPAKKPKTRISLL